MKRRGNDLWRSLGGETKPPAPIAFTIVDAPAEPDHYLNRKSRFHDVIEALKSLPPGKRLLIPHNTFGMRNPVTAMWPQLKKHGLYIRSVTKETGVEVWTETEPARRKGPLPKARGESPDA